MNFIDHKIDLQALSNGNNQEFDKLFYSFYPKVKSFLFSMLANKAVAEDLAQESFIRLYQNRELLCNVHNLNAYIYQTVKNVLYAFLSKDKDISLINIEDAYEMSSSEGIEDNIYSHELEDLISKAINRMPAKRQQIFRMSREQNLSIEEISQKLNISKRTVETHISLALSTLRKIITSLIMLLNC